MRSLPFWKRWNFGRLWRICAHKHLPMCRGTTFLHIHRGPPYTFAQITPLNPIFMGHRFNLDNGTLCLSTPKHNGKFGTDKVYHHYYHIPSSLIWESNTYTTKKNHQKHASAIFPAAATIESIPSSHELSEIGIHYLQTQQQPQYLLLSKHKLANFHIRKWNCT